MDTPSALSQELVEAVRSHLDAGRFKEALELPGDNKYAASLKDNCWDLIPLLLGRIKDDTLLTWPALQHCCERLMLVVAERANAEEILLELIEQAEIAENDARFIALLKPLQTALVRVDKKRTRSLEWCLNTITTYLDKLSVPADHDFSDQERLLMDCDEDVRRILKIYAELPIFYDYFIDQVSKNATSSIRNVLICFIVSLFGKPFCCLDFESDDKTKSQSRVQSEKLFKELCLIQPDLFIFLEYVKKKCYPPQKSSRDGVFEDAPVDIFLFNEHLTPESLGTIFYLFLAEHFTAPHVPRIYSPVYIYEECLSLSIYLMKQKENLLQYKGVRLGSALVEFIPDHASHQMINSESHSFLRSLSQIAVYCTAESIRREAVTLIRKFIFKFDCTGRHLNVHRLYPTLTHSGIKGYIINIYKDILLEIFPDDQKIEWFASKPLPKMLRLFCALEKGPETDLVDSADYVISSLNFLRFLVLKDSNNKSGIWNRIKEIQDGYLTQIREGLVMSQAHYEANLIGLKDAKPSPMIDVTIGMSRLEMPTENKREVINSGLNALHLINSLLSRLEECIQSNRPKL